MGLTPLLPPNFLVSNGATSYDAHPLSYDRKAKRLSTPTHPQRISNCRPLKPRKMPTADPARP